MITMRLLEGINLNSDTINFDRVCRCCLREYEEMLQLTMDYPRGSGIYLYSMLSLCSNVMIDVNDDLPQQICKECAFRLCTSYTFDTQCRNAVYTINEYRKRLCRNVNNSHVSKSPNGESPEIIDFYDTTFKPLPQPPLVLTMHNPIELIMHDDSTNDRQSYHEVSLTRDNKYTQTVNELSVKEDDTLQTLAELKLQLQTQNNSSHIICTECGKMYTKLRCHRKHMLEAHGVKLENEVIDKEMECQVCKVTFSDYRCLKRHVRVSHNKRKVYVCNLCNQGFNKYFNFTEHTDFCSVKEKYSCNQCTEEFPKQKLLNSHLQSSHLDIVESSLSVKSESDEKKIELLIKNENTTGILEVTDTVTNGQSEVDTVLQPFKDSLLPNSDVKEEPLDDSDRDLWDTSLIDYLQDEMEEEVSVKCSEFVNNVKKKVGRPRKYPLGQNDSEKPFGKMKYCCDECPKGFQSETGLKIHKAKHYGEQVGFECNLCGEVFSKLSVLKRHKIIHGNLKQYQCDVCGKGFNRQNMLERHMSNHFEIKPYQCDECSRSFLSSMKLGTHKLSMHSQRVKNPKVAFCAICNQGFTTKQYLSTHIRMHNGDRTFTCDICEKSFNSKWHLREHTKWHSSEKQFLCSECGQRFIRNDYLVIHMRRHKGEKPYKCKFCDKGFPRSTDLTVHERYHTGEKTHLCPVCGKGFQRQYNLTVHQRVHTGERPYSCSFCTKRFAQSNDLKSHVRRHTGERSSCDVCGEGFIQGYHLTQHKRSVHGIECKSHIRRVEKHPSDDPDISRKMKLRKRNQSNHNILQNGSMENAISPEDDNLD